MASSHTAKTGGIAAQSQSEWTFTVRAGTHAELVQEVKRASDGPDTSWEWETLPELVGSRETCELLGIQKMTLNRWLKPDSGEFPPDRTYMIPPKRIDAGPVWTKADVLRFRREKGRQRAKPHR
jgi:hypothetical protein